MVIDIDSDEVCGREEEGEMKGRRVKNLDFLLRTNGYRSQHLRRWVRGTTTIGYEQTGGVHTDTGVGYG